MSGKDEPPGKPGTESAGKAGVKEKPVKLGVFKAPAKKAPAKRAPARRIPRKVAKKAAPKQNVKTPPLTPQFSANGDLEEPGAEEGPGAEVLPFPAQLSVAEVDEGVEKVFEGEIVDPLMIAYKARIMGKPWHQVAQEAGYDSPDAAYRAVKTLLLSSVAEQRTERRMMAQMEAEHTYDAILAAHMPAAVGNGAEHKPDVNAAMVSLRARQAKDRIMRLGENDGDIDAGRTIVIAGTEEGYIASLKEVVGVVDAEVVEEGAAEQPRGDSTPG